MADRRRNRRLRRAKVVGAVLIVVLAAGGGVAWAVTGPAGPRYRVANAEVAAITQTVNSVGVVHAVNKAAVSFPVPGRVAEVPVAVGRGVAAGQVLATLDTTTLTQAIAQAKQTVAQDQLKLADDQNTQASTSTASSANSAPSANNPTSIASAQSGSAGSASGTTGAAASGS